MLLLKILFVVFVVVASAKKKKLGVLNADELIDVALTLPYRNQSGLDQLLVDLYDPTSPLYGQYLVPSEFKSRFCPSDDDITEIKTVLDRHSLTITKVAPNNVLVHVHGRAADVSAAFQVEFNMFKDSATEYDDEDHVIDGNVYFYSTLNENAGSLPGKAIGLIGLENRTRLRHHATKQLKNKHLLIEAGTPTAFIPRTTSHRSKVKVRLSAYANWQTTSHPISTTTRRTMDLLRSLHWKTSTLRKA